jgi:hypothetical protein
VSTGAESSSRDCQAGRRATVRAPPNSIPTDQTAKILVQRGFAMRLPVQKIQPFPRFQSSFQGLSSTKTNSLHPTKIMRGDSFRENWTIDFLQPFSAMLSLGCSIGDMKNENFRNW